MIGLLSSFISTASFAASVAIPYGCSDMEAAPANAEFVRTHGVDFAVFPSRNLPRPFTGCQHMWVGDADEPSAMMKLSIAYFKNHHVQWIVGQEPDEQPFKCIYRNGELILSESENAKKCPTAAAIERQQ